MNETWARPVEQVLLSTAETKARVIGVVSAEANSGVSTMCVNMADAASRAGSKTLLADFSEPVLPNEHGGWSPSDGATQIIKSNAGGYDVLHVRPTAETRSKFNNITALQHLLNEELKAYDQIIIDLPSILHPTSEYINPVAAARASDSVIMVCVTSRTKQSQMKAALGILDTAGVNLGGVVINDVANAPLGQRIAESARKLARWSERLSGWLERKALKSDFLNTPL